ncbi:MAG: hypothetical protein CMI36_15620 [Owenweeksia sp.]|nr:hypothetical protein [Owenweeksia sp.]MBG00421.1 hypothetical protein [Owenweeksia sp.]HBF20869.1 hypothetical protein [Cryomorphaceae bacterium]
MYKFLRMRRSLLLSVVLIVFGLVPFRLMAQQKHTIEWSEERSTDIGRAPSFKNAVFTYEQPDLLKSCHVEKVDVPGEYEVEISEVTYTSATAQEQSLLQNKELPTQPRIIEVGYGESQGQVEVSYCVTTYVKQSGMIRKITGFSTRLKLKGSNLTGRLSVQNFKNTSVLSTDDWHKFSVEKDGVYKLTPAFLKESGVKLDNTPISSLRVAGNGNGILPEANSAPRKDDLLDIPLKVVDVNNNGLFDGSDYALFFARGPHVWNYDASEDRFRHTLNFYRDVNYYFVSVNSGQGLRIANRPGSSATPDAVVTTYDDYQFKEDDLENLVGAGRVWVGDVFDFDLDNNYGFNFPDLVRSVPVNILVRAVARSSTAGTFMEVKQAGNTVMTIAFDPYQSGENQPYVTIGADESSFTSAADNFSLNLRYDNSLNPTGVAWLDYIEVQVKRNLIYRNNALLFRDINSVQSGNVTEFRIANANAQTEVWDVTDINQAFGIDGQLNGTDLSIRIATDSLREMVAVKGNDFPAPTSVGKVENQNLHAMSPMEMVIVTHKDFLPAAERLAEFHESNDGMEVGVVTTNEVFNEFSSGGQDITAIRDFVRMLYTRSNGSGTDLKYLCLMGDASYDYRDRLTNNNNFVPVWLRPGDYEAFNLQASSISDDYYGYLDPSEGSNLITALLDIGIGRVPCGSLGQAQGFVDKVIHYATGNNRFGDWRNKILLMADDLDDPSGWERKFVNISNSLEQAALQSSNAFNVDKIYIDAYKQVTTSGSESYPEASKDMFRKIQQGNLVTNYIGHGGEIGLASEKFLQLSDINNWTNYDAMPLFLTITCEFTRFDDPKRVSAGEQLLLNPDGGAISLVSTTRVVDVETASEINQNIFDSLLTRPNNLPKRLGEIIKDAKNGTGLRNNPTRLKFSLFGDPSLRLAIPYFRVQTNEINGKPVAAGNLDTLEALSKITMKGQINDLNDQKMDDFNGVLNISVFDKPTLRQTLNNDKVLPAPQNFSLQNSLIYRGKVNVINGDFNVEFLVPLDIAYQYGFGKISYYATNNDVDAAGVFDTIVVGGFNDKAPADNTGPEVKLYINDESFVRGGITNDNPELYAVISDSSGVNTVGTGIGHDLVAVLDNQTDQSYVVNEYYEADLDSYQSGSVRYPFFDLEEGEHTLKLKVFDVYNNFSEAETEFIVTDDEDLALKHVLNYPNPFTTYTEFQFEHNRANQPMDIQIQVFTVSGKLVKTINTTKVPNGNRVTGIAWNGLDDYGDKIGKGVYVYRVKVRTQADNVLAEKYEKLVILR